MQEREYRKLREFDQEHWWLRAQRRNVLERLAALSLPPGSKVLDAGCGSGATLNDVAAELKATGFGIDSSHHAMDLWVEDRGKCQQAGDRTRNHQTKAPIKSLGSIDSLPYQNQSFDVVYSVDVLCCAGVNRLAAMQELARVVRPGGAILLLVPAYDWMRSQHDAAVHCDHRFTRRELMRLARQAGVEVILATHRFAVFLPVLAALRLGSRWLAALRVRMTRMVSSWSGRVAVVEGEVLTGGGFEESDLGRLPSWLNGLLFGAARMEQAVFRTIHLPFGSTILMMARKPLTSVKGNASLSDGDNQSKVVA